MVFLALLLTTACTSLPIVIPLAENSFLGINTAAARHQHPPGRVHVLPSSTAWGPRPNEVDGFILTLANRLRLVQISQKDARSP